jgi:hypothetical protein
MPTKKANSRGFVLAHLDWYENPDESEMLRRNASIMTLNPEAFLPNGNTQIVRHGYVILEPPDVLPFAYTVCDCRVIENNSAFDNLQDAFDRLEELGVRQPKIGFNPAE